MCSDALRVDRASEMYKRLSVFDGVVSSLLFSTRSIPQDLYEKILRTFGDRVLLPTMSSSHNLKRFQEFNCDRMLIDCYAHWRDSIFPVDLRENLTDTNRGWKLMDRFCHQKRRYLSSPSRTEMFVISHLDEDNTLFDFYPIIVRIPIKAPQHRLNVHTIRGSKGLFAMTMSNTLQEVADDSALPSPDVLVQNSKSNGELNRVHLSYFRYLISRKKFSQHIHDIVEALSASDSPNMNPSNQRRRRSSVSLDIPSIGTNRTSCCDPLDLFTLHCLNFFSSFGTGLLIKISNDIVNSFVSPSNNYIRSLICDQSAVRKAPTESHSIIRKYLAQNFFDSIKALVADRAHGETPEDVCMSFLFRAELAMKAENTYRVISSLIYASVRFIIAETRNELGNRNFFQFFFGSRENQLKTRLIEWLSVLGLSRGESESISSCSSTITSSPLMLTMLKENRDEIEVLYREISVCRDSIWEDELAARVRSCERLCKADLRLLITTANGLGIEPVPLNEESPEIINQTVLEEDTAVISAISEDPMQKLIEELRLMREELSISKRNSEILYMELSKVKHQLAIDQESCGQPDEEIKGN